MLHINRLPARAAFVPYRQKVGDSSYSLNGEWKFRWTPVPDERVFDFYRTEFDDSGWEDFLVPSNWEIVDTVLPFMCRQAILSVLTHLV